MIRVLASPTLARCEQSWQGLDQPSARVAAAAHAEGQDGPGLRGEVALGEVVDTGRRKAGEADPFDGGAPGEELRPPGRVVDVAVHAQGQGLEGLAAAGRR